MPCTTKSTAGVVLSILLGRFVFAACVAPLQRNTAPILHPSVVDLGLGHAVEGSYLVAVRAAGDESRFDSQTFDAPISQDAPQPISLSDDRIASWRFLATVDLTEESQLMTKDSQSFAVPLGEESQNLRDSDTTSIGALFQVDFGSLEQAQQVLGEWARDEGILYAEPNYISQLSQSPHDEPRPNFKALAANYRQANDWWLERLAMPEAFEALSSRSDESSATDVSYSPVIALLDSGVDYEHPALKKNIWNNPQIGIVGCDNDRHGCNPSQPKMARRGRIGTGEVWPFGLPGPAQSCLGQGAHCAHGTHVAGIIVGDPSWEPTTGEAPIRGLCPICRVMSIQVVSKIGAQVGILDSSILSGLRYVSLFRDRDGQPLVRLVNASFGKFARSRSVSAVIRNLRQNHGILLIGAAGNEGSMRREYPAAYADAIAVAATDADDRKGSYSNFGIWVDLSAPGQSIRSTTPGAGTDVKSGTSMATPMVTAIAGLILAKEPTISVEDLEHRLIAAADPRFYQAPMDTKFSNGSPYYPKLRKSRTHAPLLGAGIINAASAVKNQTFENPPLYRGEDRVKPGCSTVLAPGHRPNSAATDSSSPVAILLLLPLAIAMAQVGRKYWPRSTSVNS